jgi:hypothetical protein
MTEDFQLLEELKEIHVVNIVKDYVRDLNKVEKFNKVFIELKEKVYHEVINNSLSTLVVQKGNDEKILEFTHTTENNLQVCSFTNMYFDDVKLLN